MNSAPRARGKVIGMVGGAAAALVAAVVALVVALSGNGAGHPVARSSGAPSSASAAPTVPPTSPPASPDPRTFPYIDLKAGDCISLPGLTTTLAQVALRDCGKPHDAQVTGLTTLPTGLTTGLAIEQHAGALCDPIDQHAYDQLGSRPQLRSYALFPSLVAYSHGTLTATCALSVPGRDATKLISRLK